MPSLELLAERHDVLEVVTQPDRPAGRGRRLTPPPVKRKAEELSLPVFQPERIRDDHAFDRLVDHAPDVIAVVGYGQMIPKRIRELSPHGCVNVHSSLLPKYRGAAPGQLGACKRRNPHRRDHHADLATNGCRGHPAHLHGPEIMPGERASELNRRLAPQGANLLMETLRGLQAGTLRPIPQDHDAATFAPLIRREDGLVDWSLSATAIHNRLRGFDPWPGIYSFFRGKRIRIHEARVEGEAGLAPGSIVVGQGQLSVGCGAGRLVLEEVQLEGRNRMAALDFAHGYRAESGEVLANG